MDAMRLLEIRSYVLKPGTRDEYDRLFREEASPLLERHGIDVVAYGSSIGDPNGYFLMRAFDNLEDRRLREDAFYSSPEWRQGPRRAVVSRIVVYTDALIELDDEAIETLRRALAH
jgi:NIPSNAP